MARQFVVNQTFEAEVNRRKNRYLAARRYTVRDGPIYDDLRKKAEDWEEKGLITWLGEVPNRPAGSLQAGE